MSSNGRSTRGGKRKELQEQAAQEAEQTQRQKEADENDCTTLTNDYFDALYGVCTELTDVGATILDLEKQCDRLSKSEMKVKLAELAAQHKHALEAEIMLQAQRGPSNDGDKDAQKQEKIRDTRRANAEQAAACQGLEGAEADQHVADAEARGAAREAEKAKAALEAAAAKAKALEEAAAKAAREAEIANKAFEAERAEKAAEQQATRSRLKKAEDKAKALEAEKERMSKAPSEAGDSGSRPSNEGGKRKRKTRDEKVEELGEEAVAAAEAKSADAKKKKQEKLEEAISEKAVAKEKAQNIALQRGKDEIEEQLKLTIGICEDWKNRFEKKRFESSSYEKRVKELEAMCLKNGVSSEELLRITREANEQAKLAEQAKKAKKK